MSFIRLMGIKEIIDECERDRTKEQFIQSAFIAFQLGAADKMTFGEYLKHLGLSDDLSTGKGTQDTANSAALFARMGIEFKVEK